MKLFADVHDLKYLARHVDEFRKALRDDLKSEDLAILKKHLAEFEHEVHDEASQMLTATKKDFDHYLATLHSIAELKAMLAEMREKNPRFRKIMDTELQYAKIIHKGLHQKLAALERVLARMRNRQ